MERIITTIFTLFITITISAQSTIQAGDIVDSLSMGSDVTKSQNNFGNGYISKTLHFSINQWEPCTKETCNQNVDFIKTISKDELEAQIQKNKKEEEKFQAVCSELDKLMKISDESYHFETHKKDKDTVIYSLCIKNATDTIRKENMSVSYSPNSKLSITTFPDATETISFIYWSIDKGCGKHNIKHGDFNYASRIPIPRERCTPFEQEKYLSTINPILKQKGIKSWNFNWVYDASYADDEEKYQKDFHGGSSYSREDGKFSKAGKIKGTMYFIPKENPKLAEAVLNSIDSLTQLHINKFPYQKYSYDYDEVKKLLQSRNNATYKYIIHEVQNINNQFHLYIGKSDIGYYIVEFNSDLGISIPNEWYKLKSFVNGKKEYIK